MRSVISPLIINSGFLGNHESIFPGNDIEFYVSVINQGEHHAIIEASIEILDESSRPLEQWLNPRRARLALAPQEAQTVLFQIAIPENAWSHAYQFDLIIDSPEHYPEYTPLHYPHSLRVKSPLVVTETGKDPSFFLNPVTTSIKPRLLKPGEVFEVEVMIDNSSYLVDRFHVLCRDLDPSFYSIHYPEVRNQYGLVVEADGLELNPGCKGSAHIKIHPPLNASAGKFFPTITLKSSNNTQIDFLDVIYFDIPVAHDLKLDIEDVVKRIKNPKKESGLYKLAVKNQGNTDRNLRIFPRNRSWGKLDLSLDNDILSLKPGDSDGLKLTAKPVGKWWNRPFFGVGKTFRFEIELEDLQGYPIDIEDVGSELLWEAYPKKWLRLFITLLVILGISAAIGLALLIWNLFFRQPAGPKILAFKPDKRLYSQERKDVIRLEWQIQNTQNLRKIIIAQKFNNGTTEVTSIETYEFKDGKIPSNLILSRQGQQDNICDFEPRFKEKVLVCRAITTRANQPGNYQFELRAFDSMASQSPVVVQSTDTIQYQAASVPNISDFNSARTNYIESPAQRGSRKEPILLNWEIRNPYQIEQLKLGGFFLNGKIAQSPVTYNFQNGALPKELKPFCKLDQVLTCRNVPTGVTQAGLYLFRLSIVTDQGQENPSLTRATETIEIKARENAAPSPRPTQLGTPPVITIPPSGSVPRPTGGTPRPPAGAPRSSTNPNLPTQQDRQRRIADAGYLRRGLSVARQRNLADPNGRAWDDMEKAIFFLSAGESRAEAARQSGVSPKAIDDLIRLGMNPNAPLPQEGGNSPQFEQAPEPVWNNNSTPTP
jgi:hypothetical protein